MKYEIKEGHVYESAVCEGLTCRIRYVDEKGAGITIEGDGVFHENYWLKEDVCEYLTRLRSKLKEVA